MSYELSGLGAARPAKTHKLAGSKLPPPNRWSERKRRTRPNELLRTVPRLPAHWVRASELSGLGFSLKPPKWIRKMQPGKILKKVAVPLAVVGASLLIPGVGGALVKGATSAGKFALGAGKLAFKGVTGAGKFALRTAGFGKAATAAKPIGLFHKLLGAAGTAAAIAPLATSLMPRKTTTETILQPSEPVPYNPPTVAPEVTPPTYWPSEPSAGGGGYSSGGGAPMTYDSPAGAPPEAGTAPAGGMDMSTLIPVGLGLVALVAVSGVLKRRRR
jgi:hypothetical protein